MYIFDKTRLPKDFVILIKIIKSNDCLMFCCCSCWQQRICCSCCVLVLSRSSTRDWWVVSSSSSLNLWSPVGWLIYVPLSTQIMASPVQFSTTKEISSKISGSPVPAGSSYAEAKKMKSLTLHTVDTLPGLAEWTGLLELTIKNIRVERLAEWRRLSTRVLALLKGLRLVLDEIRWWDCVSFYIVWVIAILDLYSTSMKHVL